jgi:hypothetical protein
MADDQWLYDVLDEPLDRIREILTQRGEFGWEAFSVIPNGKNVFIFLKKRAGPPPNQAARR